MGATNTTANYNLSQFIGTDKPAWLQDYNGDMLKIDTGINAAKVAADGAQNSADAAQNDATTANNAITNTINPAISSLNNTVGNQGGAINTINSLIGNGTPTTTDQTIIGAINEINARISNENISEGSSVDVSSYVNNPYVSPYDGYVVAVCAPSGATGYIRVDGVALAGLPVSPNTDLKSVFVRAGSNITITGDVYSAKYYPLA